jgi:hypothetical protein
VASAEPIAVRQKQTAESIEVKERHARLTARFVIQEVLQRFGEPLRAKDGAQGVDDIFDDIADSAITRLYQAGDMPTWPSTRILRSGSSTTLIGHAKHDDTEEQPATCNDNLGHNLPVIDAPEAEIEITLDAGTPARYGNISLTPSPAASRAPTPSLVTSDADVDADAYFADLARVLGRPIVERCARMDEVIAESQKRFEALLADGKRGRVASLVVNVSCCFSLFTQVWNGGRDREGGKNGQETKRGRRRKAGPFMG